RGRTAGPRRGLRGPGHQRAPRHHHQRLRALAARDGALRGRRRAQPHRAAAHPARPPPRRADDEPRRPRGRALRCRGPRAAPELRRARGHRHRARAAVRAGDAPRRASALLRRGLGWVTAYPIAVGDRVLGAFAVHRTASWPVTPETASLMGSLAAQAAVALENARLYSETTRRLTETRALLEVAEVLN